MREQEVRELYEAYLQVHQVQEEVEQLGEEAPERITKPTKNKRLMKDAGPARVHNPKNVDEEVEIAAQYFYEMGLNEEGVEILIEELGVEEFGEYVYNIAEEYYLTEARAGGVRVEPVTAKGGKFKGGKPTGKSLERLRAKKAERREAESSASEAKPSGLKSSLQRQSAIASAKKQQPKKKGILDRVAGAVLSGMERHNKAMGELKKMKSATAETAGKVKKAAGEFKKGFVGEEVEQLDEAMSSYDRNRRRAAQRAADRNAARDRGQTGNVPGVGYVSPRRERETYRDSAGTERHKTGARMPKKEDQKESFDLFDTILEYLVAEGYADTNEAALVIMANMSEEWRQSIVEGGTGVFVPSRVDDFNNRRDMLKNRYGQDVGPRIPGPSGGGQGGTTPTAGVLKLAKGTSSSKRGVESKNNA